MDWEAMRLEGASDQQFVGTVVACGTLFFALDVIYERIPLSFAGAVAPWAAMATWIHLHPPPPVRFEATPGNDLDETILLRRLGKDQRLIGLGIQFFSLAQSSDETKRMQGIWERFLMSAASGFSLEPLCSSIEGWKGVQGRSLFAWDESGEGTQNVSILMEGARRSGVIYLVTLKEWIGADVDSVLFTSQEVAGCRAFRISDELRQAYFG
jgi:hypothetical protein